MAKETKTPAKTPKKRDYGVRKDFEAPEGFQKAEKSSIIGFNTFGDKAEGYIVAMEKEKGKGKSPILSLKAKNGVVTKYWASSSIVNGIAQNKLSKGDYIMIVFTDVKELKGGRTFKDYDIYFKKSSK